MVKKHISDCLGVTSSHLPGVPATYWLRHYFSICSKIYSHLTRELNPVSVVHLYLTSFSILSFLLSS